VALPMALPGSGRALPGFRDDHIGSSGDEGAPPTEPHPCCSRCGSRNAWGHVAGGCKTRRWSVARGVCCARRYLPMARPVLEAVAEPLPAAAARRAHHQSQVPQLHALLGRVPAFTLLGSQDECTGDAAHPRPAGQVPDGRGEHPDNLPALTPQVVHVLRYADEWRWYFNRNAYASFVDGECPGG
jgi:hypothetical protein